MIEYTSKLAQLKEHLNNLPPAEKECLHDLSYPFIPNFDPLFDSSKNKVLLIGQETKGWQGRLENFLNDDINLENIIQNSKKRYGELYEQSATRSRFHQFMKKIKEVNHNEPVQWLNFYLFDYKKKSFNGLRKKSEYENISVHLEKLSIQNLSEQIKRLKPKVIFFTGQYHNNFPKLEKSLELLSNEKITAGEHIDKFNMRIWNNETLVLRMPHPAHWRASSNEARQIALNFFKIFDESKNIDDFKARVITSN